MINLEILAWIKRNLGPYIQKALETKAPVIYTEEWLGAITCREVGILISRNVPRGGTVLQICSIMRGDYSQRPGETEKIYHGYGLTQIDIGSFPEFVRSGDWKDPLKCYLKAISVLEGKRIYLQRHFPDLAMEALNWAITAAYNAGEANIARSLHLGEDIDHRTANHNYSKEVFEFVEIYKNIQI